MVTQSVAAGRRAHACGRRERAIVLLATGLIALHVVDDSFVQPQPGTSATDHLVSGLVPLGLLGLAAWAYPRLRAGWRAILALGLGIFGIAAGSEGWYYAREVGASGDDYTGLVAIPAGLALLGLGALTLWRSRRLDEPLWRRYGRRGLIVAASLIGALVLVYPLVYSYGLTHVGRAVVPEPELGADFENVSFTTDDGLELSGWYVPSRNRAAVIAFPGRKGTQRPARILVRHGYGVLLFDRRGEGDSEGDPNALGWNGTRDVEAAIAFLHERSDVDADRIGGIGLSVGGEMLLEAASEADDLKAVVSDGAGIRSVREASLIWHAVPIWAGLTAGTAVFSNHAPPPNLNDVVDRISPRPVFFIYAERGQGGEELTKDYYESAKEPKSVWKVPGATHTGGIEARPREYERRMIGFFDTALLE
jgi:MYXO-CTERM domain-containing protein